MENQSVNFNYEKNKSYSLSIFIVLRLVHLVNLFRKIIWLILIKKIEKSDSFVILCFPLTMAYSVLLLAYDGSTDMQ